MTAPQATSAPAPTTSLWEDFVDIFYAPSQVFARRRDGRFGLALLILTAISVALFFAFRNAFQPVFDAQFDQGIRAQAANGGPTLTPEQLATGRRFAGIFASVAGVLGTPIIVFVLAFLTWLAGKFFGSTATLGQATMVSTYANIPRILTSAIVGALALFADPSTLTTTAALTLSPARFLPANTSPVLLALLSRFDVTALWVTVLLGIGLSVVGKIPRGKAFAAAGLVWLVATLFALAGAARQAAMTQ
jgi:hypothetical protein